MENLLKDLRFALRRALAAPTVTAMAVLSLALGIGANTSIFTVVNALFLRSLPVERPQELAVVFGTDAHQGRGGAFMPISRPNFEDYRERNQVFTDMVNILFAGANLSREGGEPQVVLTQLVSGNYFDVLGVRPALGRFFLPEEDEVPGRNPVAVLSHPLWRQRFGADPAAVGSTFTLNAQPFTVIGVAPEGFHGTFAVGNPGLWVPVMMYETLLPSNILYLFNDRRALLTQAFGRLRPGVSLRRAQASLQVIGASLAREYPDSNDGRNVTLVPLRQATVPPQIRGLFLQASVLLMGAVALVLLIACLNVANLLLGQAVDRRQEIAVRLSMGAGRWRLIRQLLTESLLMAAGAGALGMLLAHWGRSALWALRPPGLAQAQLDLAFDPRVVLFTVAVTLATGLLFGLAPAVQATRPAVVDDLKQSSPAARGRSRFLSLRNLLVAGQVALSLIALIGSGLFVRSLGAAMAIDPGFDAERLGALTVNVDNLGLDQARGEQLFEAMLERAESTAGVASAALAQNVPLAIGGFSRTVLIEGRDPKAENNGLLTPLDQVSADYFRTAGIPLLQGRAFNELDRAGAPFVAIFNETAAKRFFPGEEAVGKRFRFINEEWLLEVVGVARDSKYGNIGEEPRPHIYLPWRQHYSPFMSLFVRAEGEPGPVLATVRNEVRGLEPNLPIVNSQTLEEVLRQSLWAPRMGATLLAVLGGLALALAVVGIYGVMAKAVRQRRREIGIRMALGARPDALMALLLRQGMLVVVLGLAAGLLLAALASRTIQALLFGLSATDPATYLSTAVILAAVAFLANLLPARRATTVDPVSVLRDQR